MLAAVLLLKKIVEEIMQPTKLNRAIVNNIGLRETVEFHLRMIVKPTSARAEGKNANIRAKVSRLFLWLGLFGSFSIGGDCYFVLQSSNPE